MKKVILIGVFALSVVMILAVIRIEKPCKDLSSFTYISPSGPEVFVPDPQTYKVVILFSLYCPFCLQYLTHINEMTMLLPDHQYGLFTTDKTLFTSSFYETWDAIRQDPRIKIGIIEISTAYALFSDPPLPISFIYNQENHHIYSLRGDRNIRELLKCLPGNNQKQEKKEI
ncbi:MAG: hypothetical protein PHE86_06675 [Candidatus Marinimicrobia bacterium]|nr:hypothetical protein [Candidatus Neomarinimicrobiota bacterium]MDD5581704.1 hypothetical protein [Candidatus Neomarinimicrobiota bacterium]